VVLCDGLHFGKASISGYSWAVLLQKPLHYGPNMMKQIEIPLLIKRLRLTTQNMPPTASDAIIAEYGRDPYLILIGCLLSLRAKDLVSLSVARELFKRARTPQQMLKLSQQQLEKIIYSIGFYRQKAKQLRAVSKALIDQFDGTVPCALDELLSLPGVGRKTANLVLGQAFGVPAICVDIHVHRISNRLGLVSTKTPEKTEEALRKILPQQYWVEYNKLLVMWGQNICLPTSPLCSRCAIADICPRIGVTRHR